MTKREFVTMDGNEAVAHVAVRTNEVIAIYPITPSSPMGEWADQWASEGVRNIWGTVPSVIEMQSEGGAAGAVHGALQTGSLTTTFTASQGLLLMIPNMYKIAGELTPAVFHIAARSLAAQALSIFGDHSDVMAARQTGWAMLCSNSVQEAMDFALIAQAATLESRIPFLHFFDGFRTSHEVAKIELLTDDDLRAMIDDDLVLAHRARALTPDRPVLRGTAQNPDVYFQARETVNPFYDRCPDITQRAMDNFAKLTGRAYHLFDYYGAPDAERVIVLMGSGCEAAEETVDALGNVGVLKVRLYRPFDVARFVAALPASVKSVAVLDRTKEPGATGEPLYQDVVTALAEQNRKLTVVGGRYGLSSKEFTPAMVKAVFDNLASPKPKNHFTVGINDDVTKTSLDFNPDFSTESDRVVRAVFYGLGADGTVGANKNSIKIIGENTDNYAQGYFVYDSKKSGSITVSHLRFGPEPIRSTYLVTQANFVACHQPIFLERYDMLKDAVDGGTFLLNTPHGPEDVWKKLPGAVRQHIVDKQLRFYVIDAVKVARESGMGGRINTVMQVCFFAISGVLPKGEAIDAIKDSIRKTYGKKGDEIVQMNLRAVDHTLEHLSQVAIPDHSDYEDELAPAVSDRAPAFVREVIGEIIAGRGDLLPVSKLPCDGTFPVATARWEKRNIAYEIPVWDAQVCIQCGKCAMVCPHAVIRAKVYEPADLASAPATFKSTDARDREWKELGLKYTIQVAPEDCTGCALCVDVCPAKNKTQTRLKAINMAPQPPLRDEEAKNWEFFLNVPELDRRKIKVTSIPQQQLQQPLFEFSGACSGCGETPYVKLASQLFGDRMIVANATGCSSIYGGNLPTTPWAVNADGRGPAWCNSLFEDNAEFGLGFRLSIDKQREFAGELLQKVAPELAGPILTNRQDDEAGVYEQRERVESLKAKLAGMNSPEARQLLAVADALVKKSVWIIGGDGWAYDIGFGGLDHVLATGRNVNVLVLDTEVYSNTGGQCSKATPRAAVAKFAAGGKPTGKKDLGLIAMTYGNVYVASVAMGARDEHTLRAFLEAESYDGPSLIIAYSHCIAHGINMTTAMQNQKAAVNSGQWLLYRYDPRRAAAGENPLQLDSRAPKQKVEEYLLMENRFKMLTKSRPEEAKVLFKMAQADADLRFKMYEYLAARKLTPGSANVGCLKGAMMDLTTQYMGLKLRSPLVVSACGPISEDIDNIRRAEDAGAAAVVLYSLFEEQLRLETHELHHHLTHGTESSPESLTYFPELTQFHLGPEGYLNHIGRAKEAVDIPVIASLNGVSLGGWVEFAKKIEHAGADGLELNVYYIPTDMGLPGAEVEQTYVDILKAVRSEVSIPVAMKLSARFSNIANMVKQLDDAGANALVLFNRFYQPDVDLEALEVLPKVLLSTPHAMRLPLRWIAILYGRLRADLAATSGIHTGQDVLKMLMVGANVTMLCSVLLKHGVEHIATIEQELCQWMDEHEYESVRQLRGSMSQIHCADPSAYERAQYMRALTGYRRTY